MEKRVFIVAIVLTSINAIIDLWFVLANYGFDIIMIAAIIFNKSSMLGSIYFTVALLIKAYKEDGQDNRIARIWFIISGIVFIVLSVVLHIDLIGSEYIVTNGVAWLGSAFCSIIITAITGRVAYDRKNKKK